MLHFDELDNLLLNHSYIDHMHLLSGDFNAHTGVMTDIKPIQTADEGDLYVTPDLQCMDFNTLNIPERRFNEDVSHDRSTYGKKLLEVCKNNNVIVYNGRLGEDRGIGRATTTYGATRDYVIGSWDLASLVTQFVVLIYEPFSSDVHCGLHTQLRFCVVEKSIVVVTTNVASREKKKKTEKAAWKMERWMI